MRSLLLRRNCHLACKLLDTYRVLPGPMPHGHPSFRGATARKSGSTDTENNTR